MEADNIVMDFASLGNHDFRLESLSIPFENIRPNFLLRPLLRAQSATLKVLKLCSFKNASITEPIGDRYSFPYGINFPHLTELELWGIVVDNLRFLNEMPNLKIMKISKNNTERRGAIRNGDDNGRHSLSRMMPDLLAGASLPENMGVEMLYMDCKIGEESLRKLKKCMPNLKKLAIIFTYTSFKIVRDLWGSSLTEIKILKGSCVKKRDIYALSAGISVKWQR